MSIEFPLRRRRSPTGLVIDPRIIVEVHTRSGYRARHFLVDTGAELSAAPRSLAPEAGLDSDSLTALDVVGIGPGRVPARLGSLPIRIGGVELSVRCLFLDQRNAPLVLGCADVLDRFALTIDAGRVKIVLTPIPRASRRGGQHLG